MRSASILAYAVLAAGTLLWCAPFVSGFLRTRRKSSRVDRNARWGVALECVGYSLLWQGPFWRMAPAWWRFALSLALFLLACLLSWTGAQALGKQWRIDAALGPGQTLVKSGPYRLVRHPIYASMLCVLLGTGFVLTRLPLLLVALAVFLAGTEIRIRSEDRLLEAAFGEQFAQYRRTVPGLIPFVK
jgi:protein-S-isoprenylcysteine O-methyltransferase Ste14